MDIPTLIKVIPSRRISCLSNDDNGSKEGKESLLISLRQQIKCKDDELVSKEEQAARLEATIASLEERLITMSLDLASSKAREDVLSLVLSKSTQKQHDIDNDTIHNKKIKKSSRPDSNLLMSSLPNLGSSFIDLFRRKSDNPLELEDTTSEDTTLLEDSSLASQNHITSSNTVPERRASLFSTLQWSLEE